MSTHHATLIGLPNEILGIIEKNLRQKDLNSLCRASKVLYNALNPSLWKAIIIRAEDEWKLEDLNARLVLRPHEYCPPQNHIHYVKNVTITAPIHQRTHCRGEHRPDEINRFMYGLESDRPKLVDQLASSLEAFFQQLGDDQLREFSWNLGTCLPRVFAPLFGRCGYITLKQSSIESLSLITENTYPWRLSQDMLLELRFLKKLKHLSWKGLRATKYFKDLEGVLECNADHLQSLELDVVDWDRTNYRWYRERSCNSTRSIFNVATFLTDPKPKANFLAWQVLQLQPSIHRVLFSELADLSLSHISFVGAASELACAFNGNMLRSLRLHNCRDCPSFLHALIDSADGIRLKLFHLSIDDRDPAVGKNAVRWFLYAFEGLEELGLLIKPGLPTFSYWETATRHKSTLKRFIYHERIDPGRENRFLDLYPVIERTGSIRGMPQIGCAEYLAELSLECLAVCDDISHWKSRLQLLGSRSAIKLVHIRRSGVDKHHKSDEEIAVDEANEEGEADEQNEDDEETEQSAPSSDSPPPPEQPSSRTPFATRQAMSLDPHRAHQIPGLTDLASWIFGPSGLQDLQVLAYGDFSYQGHYIEDTIVFGRNRSDGSSRRVSYSLLNKDERNDIMALYGDFLEACPVDPLLRLDREDMERV